MSFAKNLKVIVPGTVLALSLASAGLVYADPIESVRADTLGQYTAFKQQTSGQANSAVQVKNQTRDQVKSGQAATSRSDTLGQYIAAKNEAPAEAATALAAAKNTGSNHSGQ